jgi:hypothetical protein
LPSVPEWAYASALGSAQPGPSALLAAAEEAVAQAASEAPRLEAGAARGEAVPRPEAAALASVGVAEELQPAAAAWVSVVALLREVVPSVPLRAAPSALPSAVAWAFRRDRVLPSRPAPRPAARFAHAKACLRNASP